MSKDHRKPTLADKRRGETALTEFAEYVNAQANARTRAPNSRNATVAAKINPDQHDELSILDDLDLPADQTSIKLKDLILKNDAESTSALRELLTARLEEGKGECLFDIGTEDNGDSMHLSRGEWDTALANVTAAASSLTAELRLLLTRGCPGSGVEAGVDDPPLPTQDATKTNGTSAAANNEKDTSCEAKTLIRRVPASVDDVIETRIAVVGNVDAGKSTMLGVLVKGGLDDGRGKARVNLFRHKHEIESGRTSSVGMEIMGFDARGDVITSSVPGRKLTWEEIGRRAAKVISFTDLAGHERYLRTTVFGLLSSEPNFCLLMVAANNGLVGMSREHLGIALALNVPVMVVVTKIDICPPQILTQTLTQLTKILKSPGARKIPVMIRSRADCVQTATQFVSQRICPIFQVSNVTGESLDLVRTFLNILPHHGAYDPGAAFEFHVNDTFSVPHAGTVVSGVVKAGVVHAGDPVLVGPDALGHFLSTTVKTIQRKRIDVPACSAGQSASFALKRVRRKDVRKGMVVLPKPVDSAQPAVYREFVAEVLILSHATTIKTKYQAMLHVGPVSQTCAIIDIDRPYIRTGDRATVAFRFVQRPEWLCPGERILFREGRTKGLGIVKSCGYDPAHPLGGALEKEEDKGVEGNGVAEKA